MLSRRGMRYKDGGAMTTSELLSFLTKRMESEPTCGRVEVSLVEIRNERSLLLDGPWVHLEISAYKEFARHFGNGLGWVG